MLKPGRLSASNWFIRHNDAELPVTGATIVGATAVLTSSGGGPPNPGPDVVTYFADPQNLRGAIIPHYPVEPFADLPII